MTVGEATDALGDVPTERLEAQITELAGHLAAAECRWLELVGEFDRRKGYEAWGCISCAYWLSWHCGLDLRSARDKVRVARALESLPLIREKFGAGSISYSKVRAITRVATPRTEADLVMLAEYSTSAHLERIAAAYRRGIDLEEERRGVRERHANTSALFFWDDDGSGVLTVRFAPEDAAVVKGGWKQRARSCPRQTVPRNRPNRDRSARGDGGDGGVVPGEWPGGAQGPIPGDDPRRRRCVDRRHRWSL